MNRERDLELERGGFDQLWGHKVGNKYGLLTCDTLCRYRLLILLKLSVLIL